MVWPRAFVKGGWNLKAILLTHSHFDHVGGLAELKQITALPVAIHIAAVPMLASSAVAARLWGFTINEPPPPDHLLVDGERLEVGELALDVLFTPGHAPGHVCFYLASEGVLFDGDVLFRARDRPYRPAGRRLRRADGEHQRPCPDTAG